MTVTVHADGRPPRPVMEGVHLLWYAAGGAMLLFTGFLAVLVISGMLFRLGPRTLSRRPALVFGISTAVVVASAIALMSPAGFRPARSMIDSATTSGNVSVLSGQQWSDRSTVMATSAHYRNDPNVADKQHKLSRSLVLYEASGSSAGANELYATALSNLLSRFGDWKAHPVSTYRSGEMNAFGAVFYLGESDGPALPSAFLRDVSQSTQPVVWINGDIEQLRNYNSARWPFVYGFTPETTETTALSQLDYQGRALTVDPGTTALRQIGIVDPSKVSVLASASRTDGTSTPWAVRAANLTYIAENPLVYQSSLEGRTVTFADLLFDTLDPNVRAQHRALIRLEDVNPTTNPADLHAVVDYLASQRIPFSLGVYPVYTDPNGQRITVRLSERPALVEELRYALAHGGTLVSHGFTHQYGTKINPHTGGSGDDTEFYLCHLDEDQMLQLDGPVPEDSEAWALDRMDMALAELGAQNLPLPQVWEFPHYLASAVDYVAASKRFPYRYERALYFPGVLSGRPVDHSAPFGQLLSYAVRDVYGATVIPENLGYITSEADNIPTMLNAARNNLVVRDGVASFFYHPFLGVGQLPQMVDGLRAMGYTFANAQSVASVS